MSCIRLFFMESISKRCGMIIPLNTSLSTSSGTSVASSSPIAGHNSSSHSLQQCRKIGSEVKKDLCESIWPMIHYQMIEYFKNRSVWNTAVHIQAWERPCSMTDNLIMEEVRIVQIYSCLWYNSRGMHFLGMAKTPWNIDRHCYLYANLSNGVISETVICRFTCLSLHLDYFHVETYSR